MTDREKLIDIIVRTPCVAVSSRTAGEHIVDHLLANGVAVQRWIPVTKRLPELFKTVLVYDSTAKSVESAYMTRHKEWIGVVINHNITHWMPLPEPPKEGE